MYYMYYMYCMCNVARTIPMGKSFLRGLVRVSCDCCVNILKINFIISDTVLGLAFALRTSHWMFPYEANIYVCL